jgi:hypothetical protein
VAGNVADKVELEIVFSDFISSAWIMCYAWLCLETRLKPCFFKI